MGYQEPVEQVVNAARRRKLLVQDHLPILPQTCM